MGNGITRRRVLCLSGTALLFLRPGSAATQDAGAVQTLCGWDALHRNSGRTIRIAGFLRIEEGSGRIARLLPYLADGAEPPPQGILLRLPAPPGPKGRGACAVEVAGRLLKRGAGHEMSADSVQWLNHPRGLAPQPPRDDL